MRNVFLGERGISAATYRFHELEFSFNNGIFYNSTYKPRYILFKKKIKFNKKVGKINKSHIKNY